MLQPIRKYGDPILRKKATPIEKFGPALQQLFVDMVDTMQAAHGVGLAANQIGRTESMCVIDQGLIEESASKSDGSSSVRQAEAVRAFVNPRLLEESREENELEEGCLSIPDIHEQVTRKLQIRVRYQDLGGKEHEEVFHDMIARVLQHEIDHLNGIFFVDRLSSMRRKLLSKKLKAIAEEAQQEALERKQQRAAVE
jgi:peptide deformylase